MIKATFKEIYYSKETGELYSQFTIMTHNVKILATHASQHLRGVKPWELRNNDRKYKVGDILNFTVITDNNKEPTGMKCKRKITHILKGGVFGLAKDYCILTIQ